MIEKKEMLDDIQEKLESLREKKEIHVDPVDLEQSKRVAEFIAEYLYEKKGEDIVIMDIHGLSSIADYFVIVSAQSPLHVKALTNDLDGVMRDNSLKARHIEGLKGLQWVLIDYSYVVVHIFLPQSREYYGLESYWADAKVIRYPEDYIEE